METGCEAVLGWARPIRFRRVCPLLERNAAGYWVCRVAAPEVRPFWGRALGYAGGALGVALLLGGVAIFVFMRQVGYEVTLRQVFWPPAWSELGAAQAQLFFRQAQAHYAAGRTREAVAALETAVQIEPDNFPAGMLLAQIYQGGNAPTADRIYARLLRSHPERRLEIGRASFRSLLGQGRLEEVATLSRQQLAGEPAAPAVWTHALIFSALHLRRPDWLETAGTDSAVPAAPRAVLQLAGKVAQAPTPAARRLLLVQTPLVAGFPYDRIYRAERLLEDGFTADTLGLLGASTAELGGRDIARLALAAYATAGDSARLKREFGALLAPSRALSGAELNLLALHLVRYPDPALLAQVLAAVDRVASEPTDVRIETYLTIYCASGVQKNAAGMQIAWQNLSAVVSVQPYGLKQLEDYFLRSSAGGSTRPLPPALYPFSLECTYALLNR